jgi:trk system potassium uptake protein TrkA
MFVLVVGAGKVGLNTARSLDQLGHEFILIEQRRTRFALLRPELEDRLLFGDGTEMWVLEQAGITRADLVVAVTGDDEDNVVIAQLAKHEYHVPKVVARINDPRNRPTFELLDVDATICASTMLVSMIRHELPSHRFVPLLSLKRENIEVVEIEVDDDSPAAGLALRDVRLPDGVLVSSVLRGEEAVVARADTLLLPGDHLLCLLPPGREKALLRALVPGERPERIQAPGSIDLMGEP